MTTHLVTRKPANSVSRPGDFHFPSQEIVNETCALDPAFDVEGITKVCEKLEKIEVNKHVEEMDVCA